VKATMLYKTELLARYTRLPHEIGPPSKAGRGAEIGGGDTWWRWLLAWGRWLLVDGTCWMLWVACVY